MRPVLLVDPSARGGIATYTSRLCQALAEAGEPAVVLTSTGLQAGLHEHAREVVRALPDHAWGRPERVGPVFYARRAGQAAVSVSALLRTVRRVRPRVVHFQFGLNDHLDVHVVRAVRRRAPVAFTAHDVVPFTGPARAGLPALAAADMVIVHTEPARELLAGEGIDAVVVPHVPSAVPAGAGREVDRELARVRLGLVPADHPGPAQRWAAALGFVRDYKGYELLAQTWEAMGPDAPMLLVVGEPWSDQDALVLDRLERTGRAVVRRGYATDLDLALAARAADVVLLPHERASDSGLLHLARGVGTPVLASDAPQLAASVRGTGAGRVLERSVASWSRALQGPLPPDPEAPPSLVETGRAHLEVYAAGRTPGRPRLLLYSDATDWGGAEAVAAALALGLADRFLVTVAGVDGSVVRRIAGERPDIATLLLDEVAGKTDLRGSVAHVRALRRAQPDIVLANLQVPWTGQYGLAAALALGVPVVALEHCPVEASGLVQRRLKQATTRRLAAHVTVSRAARRELARVVAVPEQDILVVRPGVARPRVEPLPLPTGLRRPVLGAAGRFDPVKGFDVLLEALAQVPEATLWLLGDGEQGPHLRTMAARLGLDDRVHFEGWHPQAASALAACDVVVLPSRWESAPLVAVEAMQQGVPLVASAVGGLPELVGDGAVLVPPGDPLALAAALAAVLGDDAARAALGARGAAVAAGLPTPDQMVREWEALLLSLLSVRRVPATHQAS